MIIYTNSRSSKKKKKPNAKQRELDDSWNKLMKKYPEKTLKVKAPKVYSIGVPRIRETIKYPSLNSNYHDCSRKPTPVYTGTKVKGIGTMHKSNAVPIFSDEEAVDIATMRR